MKLQKAVFVLMGVMMLLFADKLSAQQVKTDYDRSASFGQYTTYSWEQVKTKDALAWIIHDFAGEKSKGALKD